LQHPIVSGEQVAWRLNERRDTLNLWCLNPDCDSTILILSDNGLQDTLRLRFREQKKGKRQKMGTKEEKIPLLRTLCDGNKAFYDDLRLEITNPIAMVSIGATAEVMYLKDSTVTSHYLVADSNDQIRIDAALKSGEKYHVHIAKGLFTDIYGNTSDSLDFDLTPKDYGTLTLHIDNRTGLPLVIEVLDKRDTVVQVHLSPPLSPLSLLSISPPATTPCAPSLMPTATAAGLPATTVCNGNPSRSSSSRRPSRYAKNGRWKSVGWW
jgi:hypothetical protein